MPHEAWASRWRIAREYPADEPAESTRTRRAGPRGPAPRRV